MTSWERSLRAIFIMFYSWKRPPDDSIIPAFDFLRSVQLPQAQFSSSKSKIPQLDDDFLSLSTSGSSLHSLKLQIHRNWAWHNQHFKKFSTSRCNFQKTAKILEDTWGIPDFKDNTLKLFSTHNPWFLSFPLKVILDSCFKKFKRKIWKWFDISVVILKRFIPSLWLDRTDGCLLLIQQVQKYAPTRVENPFKRVSTHEGILVEKFNFLSRFSSSYYYHHDSNSNEK